MTAPASGTLRPITMDGKFLSPFNPEDGYDFTKWLRRETPPPMRYTPVILLTGHAAKSIDIGNAKLTK